MFVIIGEEYPMPVAIPKGATIEMLRANVCQVLGLDKKKERWISLLLTSAPRILPLQKTVALELTDGDLIRVGFIAPGLFLEHFIIH